MAELEAQLESAGEELLNTKAIAQSCDHQTTNTSISQQRHTYAPHQPAPQLTRPRRLPFQRARTTLSRTLSRTRTALLAPCTSSGPPGIS